MTERRAMIQQTHELAVTRRCVLLDVPRSTAYYRPRTGDDADLALMRLIDEIHLQYPFYGSRRLRDELEVRGHPVNRKRVQRLMRLMGLSALYQRWTPPVGQLIGFAKWNFLRYSFVTRSRK